MKLVGQLVEHRRYGEGLVKKQDEQYIFVFFPDYGETKEFAYPQCFEQGLNLKNDRFTASVKEDVEKRKAEEELKKAQEANKRHNERILNRKIKTNKKETEALRFSSVEEFCDHYIKLIQGEIIDLKRSGGKHVTVYEGKFQHKKADRYYYTFETDTELGSNNGSYITIYWNEDKFAGLIENCDEDSILISTEQNLGKDKEKTIQSLEFSIEGWKLLEALNERIEEAKESDSLITKQLITSGNMNINPHEMIRTGQDTAVKMSYSQPITFIWGPPGTGKTETLAKIAQAHIQRGHRILMLSYSNVSVDGAIQRVFKVIPDAKPGTILRYGYPKDEDILQSKDKYSYNYALKSDKYLYQKNRDLREELKKTDKTSDRAKEIRKEIQSITRQVSVREKEVIKEASFVATTIAKAVIDKAVYEQEFDVVIFDEASMSYVPQIVAGADMAKKHFICMGDFNQLPPIVMSDEAEYLSVDIFKHAGITDAVKQKYGHDWLCMLDTQYRMHPSIANIASASIYYGLLKTGKGIKEEREPLLDSIPEINEAYGLADLSNMMSTCIPLQDHSRANILSAFISFALASKAGQEYDAGIITPYSSQAKLLQNMAKDYAENIQSTNPATATIPCATVHQFQGSEKDVIIYDAVDCYRLPYPGVLLTNLKDNLANRLFNVALTRARGKFVVVANSLFMRSKGITDNLMFGKTISLSKPHSEMNGKDISDIDLEHDCFQFIVKEASLPQFLADIKAAKKSIYIDIPDPVEDNQAANKKIMDALELQKAKGVKVVIRAEDRKNLPQEYVKTAIEHTFCMTPVVIIDKKLTWYGMPWSNAKFKVTDQNIPIKYYPIIRFEGKRTAGSIFRILEMNNTTDESKEVMFEGEPTSLAQYVLQNAKCPDCGKPMQLKNNKKGNPFLSCTGYPACMHIDRDVSVYAEVFISNNSIKCPKCKSVIEVKYGPHGAYARCMGSGKHTFNLNDITKL